MLDALYDLVRRHRLLERLTGSDDAEVLWIGELVRRGLEPPDPRFDRCAHWDTAVAAEVEGLDAIERIALVGSFRADVAEQIVAAFGDQAEAFVEASNERAPVVLRANRRRVDREGLLAGLRAAGVDCEPGQHAPDAVILRSRTNLQALDLFKRGAFEVQDEGSQLLAELVEPTGLVVDFCAGAGGKTLAMAAMGAKRVVACDVRERALTELRKRARRAGVQVEVHVLGDDLPPAVAGLHADRVLVDAPCSGTGVLRRHPEHRWTVGPLSELVALQSSILERASGLVRPGGRLIYGTCSVLPVENEGVVEAFAQRHPEFAPSGTLRTAPHTHGTDGFYGAVLQRRCVEPYPGPDTEIATRAG